MAASPATLSAGRVAATPSTLTTPERIRTCARSRVSARPRFTNTRSSRSRREVVLGDVLVQVLSQLVPELRLPQLAQRSGLDLSDPLTGHAELVRDFAQGVLAAAGQAIT